MKKMIFGIAVGIASLSVSSFTTINDDLEGELVGKVATNQWVIVVAEDRGLTWDCFNEGTACTGTLKAGATPDSSGYYSDSEVNQIFESKHFELIEEPDGQQKY